jgi:hypothetical protein
MAFQLRPVYNGSWTPFVLLIFRTTEFFLIEILWPEKTLFDNYNKKEMKIQFQSLKTF